MRSGIYGLFRLDGAPVDPREARALGLSASAEPGAALALGVDTQALTAVDRAEDADSVTILVGEVEEQESLAARLGLGALVTPAVLARAALDRFGTHTPCEMIGEWSLLRWDRTGRVTLMMSAARRDPLLFARVGPRLAVAPDIFRLARLAWIGTSIDEAGLLFSLARADLRARRGDRTMLERVRQLEPGGCVTIDAGGLHKESAQIFARQPRWSGSFEEAVEEAERLMRSIMRSRLARTPVPAVLLSGGLDSSLLSWLASEARGESQKLLLFTSAAPAGSRLRDETGFASAVARQLGLQIEPVAAPPEADIYRPSDAILSGGTGPRLTNRHCLTEAFQETARKTGASLLVNGTYGEMTLSARVAPMTVRRRLRELAGRLARRPTAMPADAGGGNPFHVRLTSARRTVLHQAARSAMAWPSCEADGQADGLWGYKSGTEKALLQPNEFYAGAIRMDFPYRDLRLLRLFAALPANILPPEAVNRGLSRAMLAGHVPESVRLRTSGLPAEPDHYARMQRQSPSARARIPEFRKAEVHEWLDLDWLDSALAQIGERGTSDPNEANEVQLTAIAAEFLTWWRCRA